MAITSLGYLGLKASDLEAWTEFATNVLGLMVAEGPDGEVRFRADSYAWRIAVEQGEENDIAYAGFETSSREDFTELVQRLTEAKIAVAVADANSDADLLKHRGVSGLAVCHDPDGLQIEIYYGPTERREIPFVSPAGVSGFVAGNQGLGHIVLSTKDIVASRHFYTNIIGLRLSDIIHMQLSPELGVDLEFYHCNPRHHTLALVPLTTPKRLHHFMLETETFDDVGFALDRVASANVPVVNTLGRHPNDLMVSFYARTPSGFEVEYGWGAREIDATWRFVRHDRISMWGHHRQQSGQAR